MLMLMLLCFFDNQTPTIVESSNHDYTSQESAAQSEVNEKKMAKKERKLSEILSII